MPTFERPFRSLSLLPSVGVAVLSKFTCSFCLGAYAGLLSSLGVGFLATDAGLSGLTAGLLVLGLAGVAWSTRRHRHLGPLGVMLLGSGVLLMARLDQPSPMRLLVGGAALALGASLWNFRLERRHPTCCTPVTKASGTQTTRLQGD
ncbi:MAG: MerC domain-containing protein [Gemmatimonadales bacterium]|nr:MerC domain-containing protein [Gemmatimonadales bacterium]